MRIFDIVCKLFREMLELSFFVHIINMRTVFDLRQIELDCL